MPVALTVRVTGLKELQRRLGKVKNVKPVLRKALLEMAFLVQKDATQNQIIRGGKQPPHPTRLTSRTGTGRRSIRVNRDELPRAVEIGTDLVYMGVHETGGRFHPPRPYLQPALKKVSPRFPKILEKHWKRQIRG